MSEPEKLDLTTRANKMQRWRDLAVLLPITGLFLFFSPLLQVFSHEGVFLGVPYLIAFLFGSWIVLIVLTYLLSRRITDDPDP